MDKNHQVTIIDCDQLQLITIKEKIIKIIKQKNCHKVGLIYHAHWSHLLAQYLYDELNQMKIYCENTTNLDFLFHDSNMLWISVLPQLSDQERLFDISLHFSKLQLKQIQSNLMKAIIALRMPERLPFRAHDAHKGTCGTLIGIGGNLGMSGAMLLAGQAALRSGCGKVKVFMDPHPMQGACLEMMMAPLEALHQDIGSKLTVQFRQVILFGNGLGYNKDYELILHHVIGLHCPMVIDAGGLLYLNDDVLSLETSEWVLTPHLKEFACLIKVPLEKVCQDPQGYAKKFTQQYPWVILVLKSYVTYIAYQGAVNVYCVGSSALAKAGSGDVLAGVISAFIAQGLSLLNAAILGVYVHGESAKYCEKLLSEYSVLASDLIAHIPDVFRNLKGDL